MKYAITFPISTGVLVAGLKAGLSSWSGLVVQPKVPESKPKRLITVRDDSGPQEGVQSRRRYGFNVWADSSVDAENLAHAAMAVLRVLPDGAPITATDQFSGPFEIEDEPPFLFGKKNLIHFYFTCRVTVRSSNT